MTGLARIDPVAAERTLAEVKLRVGRIVARMWKSIVDKDPTVRLDQCRSSRLPVHRQGPQKDLDRGWKWVVVCWRVDCSLAFASCRSWTSGLPACGRNI
jgi:hypothetical protein